MSEEKQYTAQEMRELADKIWKYSDDDCKGKLELTDNDHDYVDCEATQAVIEMLRQAADAEEELDAHRKATKVEVHLDGAEMNAALARKVDEMRECLKEAVGFFDRLSEGIEVDKGFLTMCNKWRKALEGKSRWEK